MEKLKEIGKPYVIVLNSVRPYSSETLALKESLEQEYQAVVVPVNCQQMHREDLVTVMKAILFEFPVTRVDFAIPKWTEMLPMEHKLKAAMIQTASRLMDGIGRVRDAAAVLAGQEWVKSANEQMGEEVFRDIQLQTADLSNGTVTIRMETTEQCYFSYISEMTGMQIEGEYQMISMLRSLSRMKKRIRACGRCHGSCGTEGVWCGHAGTFGYPYGRSGADPACRKIWRENAGNFPVHSYDQGEY